MLQRVQKAADFINNFPGTREELEKALIEKIDKDHEAHKDMPPMPKEIIDKFIAAVAEKLNGKLMSPEEFKAFLEAKLAAKGGS